MGTSDIGILEKGQDRMAFDKARFTLTYDRYAAFSKRLNAEYKAALAERFPATGGLEMLVNNWYVCKGSTPNSDDARAIMQYHDARYRRMDARKRRELDRYIR